MKRLIYKLLGILIVTLTVACNSDESDNSDPDYLDLVKDRLEYMNMPRPEGSYNYPVLPGMKAWADFTSTDEMIIACQVPTTILEKQSTQAVIQAIWEYPFFTSVLFEYGRYQKDYETILLPNKAYQELIKRSDAGKCLIERYNLVEPCKDNVTFLPRSLELMISQNIFLTQLSHDNKVELMRTVFEKEHQRKLRGMPHSATTNATYLLMGRIMQNCDYKPFTGETAVNDVLSDFLETSFAKVYTQAEYNTLMNIIIDYAENFTSE